MQLGAELGGTVEDGGVEDETGVLVMMRGGSVVEMGFDQVWVEGQVEEGFAYGLASEQRFDGES